jgi:hypothetical protein
MIGQLVTSSVHAYCIAYHLWSGGNAYSLITIIVRKVLSKRLLKDRIVFTDGHQVALALDVFYSAKR